MLSWDSDWGNSELEGVYPVFYLSGCGLSMQMMNQHFPLGVESDRNSRSSNPSMGYALRLQIIPISTVIFSSAIQMGKNSPPAG